MENINKNILNNNIINIDDELSPTKHQKINDTDTEKESPINFSKSSSL